MFPLFKTSIFDIDLPRIDFPWMVMNIFHNDPVFSYLGKKTTYEQIVELSLSSMT